MTAKELYQEFGKEGESGQKATMLLTQAHWFSVNADFDPKSGAALTQALTPFLEKVLANFNDDSSSMVFHDRVWRITEHCRNPLEHLMTSLNENPMRDHAVLPIGKVRELDAGCFMKLANRPGRNIREKLAGKPYLQAVRRYQSVDIPENRLLKALALRLAELLELRERHLGEDKDPLLTEIQNWLRSDEASEISRWDNPPPNNALLSHRDYRRIWDSWRWLQSLDDDIGRDLQNLEKRQMTMRFWLAVAEMYRTRDFVLAEMPVRFDYDSFTIQSWWPEGLFVHTGNGNFRLPVGTRISVPQKSKRHVNDSFKSLDEPVCVDIANAPHVFSAGTGLRILPGKMIWQKWKSQAETFDFTLSSPRAIVKDASIATLTPEDVLCAKNDDREFLNTASLSFAKGWRTFFNNDTFIWLQPDYLNDFEVEIVRRDINSQFKKAVPLPRSIAAIFEYVDFSKIKNGYRIFVIDQIGGNVYATEIEAVFSNELLKRVPETKGFSWARHPSRPLGREPYRPLDIMTVTGAGVWSNQTESAPPPLVTDEQIHSGFLGRGYYVNLLKRHSPVCGGARFRSLQDKAAEIPLWYDYLPELSTKLPSRTGLYEHFYFVKKVRITPRRGCPVSIPIKETFTLPANHETYEFPLYFGEGGNALNYVAELHSRHFPLESDVECKLQMTYTYGADNPYQLEFVPLSGQLTDIAIIANWRKQERHSVSPNRLPVPEFPERKTWGEFQKYPQKDGQGKTNLLNWIEKKIAWLNVNAQFDRFRAIRTRGSIVKIRQNNENQWYCIVNAGLDGNIYCSLSPKNLIEDIDVSSLSIGDTVFLTIARNKKANKTFGISLSFKDEVPSDKIQHQLSTIRFPSLTVWNNGHSLQEADVPDGFRSAVCSALNFAGELYRSASTPQRLKDEIFFFLSCLHCDSPAFIHEEILAHFDDYKYRKRHLSEIAYAIGNGQLEWQRELLSRTLKLLRDGGDNGVALEILSIAVWRAENLIWEFDEIDSTVIIKTLHDRMATEKKILFQKNERHVIRFLCKLLELLLAMIRLRRSQNTQISTLLIPDEPYVGELVSMLDEIAKYVVDNGIRIETRIQLQLDKPGTCAVPDLLYALRMYLTGDSGANTICISGISDDEWSRVL